MFPNSPIAQKMQLRQTECAAAIKNVLVASETEQLSGSLVSSMFSLFVDEGMHISSKKFLCCIVRYSPTEKRDGVTQLLEVIPMNARNCVAEALTAC